MPLNHSKTLLTFLTLIWICGGNFMTAQPLPEPPRAEKTPRKLVIHNHTRTDNYYWLNERSNPKVIDYLMAENAYTEAALAPVKQLRETLFEEIVARIKPDDISVPYLQNGYYYYTRYEAGKEHPIYCRKKGALDAPEEIILDANEMAAGHDYFLAVGLTVSLDNNFLAFGVDTVSRRQYTIRIKDLRSGELMPDQIPNTLGRPVWAADHQTIFYASRDSTLRPDRIFRHRLGAETSRDELVYQEADSTFGVYVSRTKSNRYILITAESTLSTEVRFLEADQPQGRFRIFQPREREHEYHIDHFQDKFYVTTNLNAKNFRLMETGLQQTGRAHWKEVIPHREDVLLEDLEIFRDYMVLTERKNGLRQLRVINRHSGQDYYLEFDEAAYTAFPEINKDFDTDVLRYSYTSLATPNSIYAFNMRTREKKLLKQAEVLGNFSPGNYRTERFYAPAKDGVSVPISLVYRKGLKKDGKNPLLLYGYGSYGYSMEPRFRSHFLSLLDRGFVFAIAHVRGGSEMGRQWYEDGKLLKKKNTFTDFIACAEYLIAQKFTNPEKLFAMGGSAGGLLMGAVVNMRPDLFKAVIAAVPFVDVVTTMLDESIPLTTSEYDEWGNPNEKIYYDYILSYSPYDNVSAREYPAMLVTAGLHDSQVQYWEPAKWVAKLRDLKTDDHILLLHTQMEAGHSGASGRFEQYRETALEYAFLLFQLGIAK